MTQEMGYNRNVNQEMNAIAIRSFVRMPVATDLCRLNTYRDSSASKSSATFGNITGHRRFF